MIFYGLLFVELFYKFSWKFLCTQKSPHLTFSNKFSSYKKNLKQAQRVFTNLNTFVRIWHEPITAPYGGGGDDSNVAFKSNWDSHALLEAVKITYLKISTHHFVVFTTFYVKCWNLFEKKKILFVNWILKAAMTVEWVFASGKIVSGYIGYLFCSCLTFCLLSLSFK